MTLNIRLSHLGAALNDDIDRAFASNRAEPHGESATNVGMS